MSAFQLTKSMKRKLTDDEEEKVLSWWEKNQDVPITDVIDKFEVEFNTPITEHALLKAMMKRVHSPNA